MVGARDVWEAPLRDEKLGFKGLDCFRGAADGLGSPKGIRRSRCDCSGGSTSRNDGFTPLKQPTTPHKFAWPASDTWNTPHPGGQTPNLILKIRQKSPERLLIEC